MSKKSRFIVTILIIVNVLTAGYILLHGKNIALLHPAGTIALKERGALFFVAALGLSLIIPILIAAFVIAFHYREGNPKAVYQPMWNRSKKLEIFRWGLLSTVIGILCIFIWQVAHDLDPYKPLTSPVKPVRIQVVALQWRWLFIYPEYHIATINTLIIPEKTPINFELTADAPMSSFWIPNLSGQIYSMAGMSTKTHLLASTTGEFPGYNAEISGVGFANMRFTAKVVTDKDFTDWIRSSEKSGQSLTFEKYKQLAKPSTDTKNMIFRLVDQNLYNKIMMQFIPSADPMHKGHDSKAMY